MAIATDTRTVVGVFGDMAYAQNAVTALERAGYPRADISVIANKSATEGSPASTDPDKVHTTEVGSDVAADAGIGAALGGVGGLLLSFAGLAVPGVGPILAVGPIVAALTGAGIGAVTGGIIGALTESGIPEEEAHYYAEGVRRGHVLVTVRTRDEAKAEQARDVMDDEGALDVEGRASNWRERGWSNYNAGAAPLSADELRRERDYYSKAKQQGEEWTRTENEMDAGSALGETTWPHTQAHTIGESLSAAETRNAAVHQSRAVPPAAAPLRAPEPTIGDVSPVRSDMDTPSNFGDAIDNNVRRPDPAVVRAERGFEDAKDSASRSARRMSRIYVSRNS